MPSILIINPNSSKIVTQNLMHLLDPAPDFTYKFFTGPSSDPSVTVTDAVIAAAAAARKSSGSTTTSHTKTSSTSTTGGASIDIAPPPPLSNSADTHPDAIAVATAQANAETASAIVSSRSATPAATSRPTTTTTTTTTSQIFAPAEIDSFTTSITSAAACLPLLLPMLDDHDAFLVACFSDHPLVHMLREKAGTKPVLGIFHASVLNAIAMGRKFAIVTTLQVWEKLLDDAVLAMLGSLYNYAGTISTGMGVLEIHDLPHEQVTRKLVAAAREAVDKRGATILIMGCASLSGLDSAIRHAVGPTIPVIDGVVAGTDILAALVRSAHSSNAF